MKITLEFEYPCELIDLLEPTIIEDYCTLSGTDHIVCNAPNCKR